MAAATRHPTMPPTWVQAPWRTPVDDMVACQEAIRSAGWWDMASLTERWPLTSMEAAKLLHDGGEFAVDAAALEDIVARRLIPSPAVDDESALEWSAPDVLMAADLLDTRQSWRPNSGHDSRKHLAQRVLDRARETGQLALFCGHGRQAKRFDVPDVLWILLEANDREARLRVLPLLKGLLQHEHGVYIP